MRCDFRLEKHGISNDACRALLTMILRRHPLIALSKPEPDYQTRMSAD